MTTRASVAPADASQLADRLPSRRRRWITAAVAAVLIGTGAAVAGLRLTGAGSGGQRPGTSPAYATSLATVTREATLSARTRLSGRLGFAGSYSIRAQAAGTVTAVPGTGAVIEEGGVLYRTDDQPVILLYGATPMYRDLAEGTAGRDVAQLNRDLVRLGYASGLSLDPGSDEFGWATRVAVERLQGHLGTDQTGRLGRGQAVFLPSAARVTAVSLPAGGPAVPGATVLQATSTTRQVTVALDAAQQTQVRTGDPVTITLPSGRSTPGTVSAVGTVATPSSSSGSGSSSAGSGSSADPGDGGGSDGSSPTISVQVTPGDPAALGNLDQAPVQVTIVSATVKDALAVPVTALLSQPGGRFAVEVAAGTRPHRLITVQTGLFDEEDGLVQVTGAGLAAGQRVVVPAS